MKRYVIYSIILHVLLLSLAFLVAYEKKDGGTPPFIARIVTPDELRQAGGPKAEKTPKGIRTPQSRPAVKTMPAQKKSGQKALTPKRSDSTDNKGMKLHDKSPAPKAADKGVVQSRQQGAVENRSASETSPFKPQSSGGETGTIQKGIHEGESKSPSPPKPLREKLFDRDIIGKMAQKEKDSSKPDSNITFDTKEYKYYGYLQRLKEKIESAWRYPPEAAEKGIYGDLYIKFTIKKNGRLSAIEVVRTSGHKSLDDGAIKALKEAEPYWPLPNEWGQEGFTITGHFVYSLYGTYIR